MTNRQSSNSCRIGQLETEIVELREQVAKLRKQLMEVVTQLILTNVVARDIGSAGSGLEGMARDIQELIADSCEDAGTRLTSLTKMAYDNERRAQSLMTALATADLVEEE